jgi:hypothetical protein
MEDILARHPQGSTKLRNPLCSRLVAARVDEPSRAAPSYLASPREYFERRCTLVLLLLALRFSCIEGFHSKSYFELMVVHTETRCCWDIAC